MRAHWPDHLYRVYRNDAFYKSSAMVCQRADQIKASAPHLVWALGHFLTFVAGMRYLVTAATFAWSGYDIWYRVAYLGAIISYGVVIYKSFGVPRTDRAYVQRALMDENVQYLSLIHI